MEINILIIIIAQAIIAIVLGFVIKSFLPTYFSKKGENLATKEDIEEITEKIESVRIEYAQQQHRGEMAFNKEFMVLSEVWETLVELRGATFDLRPRLDSYSQDETEEQRKQRRLGSFGQSYNKFVKKFDENQPFYPKDIYSALDDIRSIVHSEALEYEHAENSKKQEYWESAQKNKEKILKKIDEVCELIRSQITLE